MSNNQINEITKISFSPELRKTIEICSNMQESIPEGVYSMALNLQKVLEEIPKPKTEAIAEALSKVVTPTKEIIGIQNMLLENSGIAALQTLCASFEQEKILVQNFAVAQMLADCSSQLLMPFGTRTVGKQLHKKTIDKMMQDTEVMYDNYNRGFCSDDSDLVVSSVETNIIYSATDLFKDLTAKELIDFISSHIDCPEYSCNHPVGKAIYDKIKSVTSFAGLDSEYYYHARAIGPNDNFFSYQDMLKAPQGISNQGRFNHIGRSHYYFSDTKDGAVAEVRRHLQKDSKIQVVTLKAKQNARLFDISEDIKEKSVFLDYCRQAPNYSSNSNLPREYILPCFLASTCKMLKIDGIKYYGNKNSNNYVTWQDNYFDFVESDIID